jgi:hypothetical protein
MYPLTDTVLTTERSIAGYSRLARDKYREGNFGVAKELALRRGVAEWRTVRGTGKHEVTGLIVPLRPRRALFVPLWVCVYAELLWSAPPLADQLAAAALDPEFTAVLDVIVLIRGLPMPANELIKLVRSVPGPKYGACTLAQSAQ